MHRAERRTTFVAKVFAVSISEANLVGKSFVRFYPPIRRLVEPVIRIVMSVRSMLSST